MKICFLLKNNLYLSIIRILFFLFSFCYLPIVAINAQNSQIQWANAIKQCSNENDGGAFSPKKSLGKPDVTPIDKLSPEAWTVKFPENFNETSIEVIFDEAIKTRKVFIAENLGIGLKTIILKDEKGKEHDVYNINENYDFSLRLKAKISHVILYKKTDYYVKSIRVIISKPFMGSFCQIDGIGISSEDVALDYETKGNKLQLPKVLLQAPITKRQVSKQTKTIAFEKNITTYFQNREVSKYILQGKFINDTVKITKEIKVQLINLSTNDSLTLLTEKDGSFQIGLDEAEYLLFGFQQGYLATPDTKISMLGKRMNEIVRVDIPIRIFQESETYLFYDINFDINSDSIDMKSHVALKQIFMTLRENPNALVQIEVHTDARGDDVYNLLLTEKRATRIARYLETKGIQHKRLITKGLGEKELKNRCANGVRCDNSSHRENRRIEMEIVRYLE